MARSSDVGVQVPELLMPPPAFVVTASDKEEWLDHLSMEDIEVVLSPIHLGEESLLVIPDVEHSSFDLHALTALIQLPEANDRVPKRVRSLFPPILAQ